MADGGFLTVHDASLDEGGEDVLASVRGTSTYLAAGVRENVSVTLDSPITNDSTLVAMPHKDTDGDRIYDFVSSSGQDDAPYVFEDAIVTDSATVSATAAVNMTAQSSNGSSVVVDRTELAAGGFVAIHDASLLDGATFDSVRGTSDYLAPGEHSDVEISLDDPLTETQAIIAMPHLDTNGNEEYDFVSSEGAADGPYTNAPADSTAGPIVVAAAEVTVEMGDMAGGSSTPDDDQSTPDGSSGDGAGFGLVAALLAIVALTFLARRH